MNEQEIPFEEYAVREQEESMIFPEYRDNGKLIPRQRPRGNLHPLLIPVVVILAFLLFSYVAGYAFYAHTSFNSGYYDQHFYDHDHFDHHQFPQQQFDQPNQPDQPNQSDQPNQTIPEGQPAPIAPGTMPRIMVHHSTGPGR